MLITDYDLNTYQNAFTVEVNDNQKGEIKISDFFHFLADLKAWFYSEDQQFIVIPDVALVYNKELKSFLCDTANVKVFTFDAFCKEYTLELKSFLSDYTESGMPIVWGEIEEEEDHYKAHLQSEGL